MLTNALRKILLCMFLCMFLTLLPFHVCAQTFLNGGDTLVRRLSAENEGQLSQWNPEDYTFPAELPDTLLMLDKPYVIFSVNKLELAAGRTEQISYTLTNVPKETTKMEWTSKDSKIATVNAGSVKGIAPGETVVTLTLTLEDGQTIVTDCAVEVYHSVSSVKSLSSVVVGTGESSEPISVTVSPEDAKYQGVTFTSADEKIAKVSKTGVITGVSVGNTTITITSNEPVTGKTAAKSHKITVKVIEKVKLITLDKKIEVGAGRNQKIVATVGPENATNPKLKWESSDTTVATITSDGTVRGVSTGTATITATSTDESEISASCQVEVFQPVTSLKPKSANVAVQVGTSLEPLVVAVSPENAKYQGLSWQSSDEAIARVDQQGVVTGVSLGKAKITVTSTEPSATPKTAVVTVAVVQMVTDINLDHHRVEVAKGKNMKLQAAAFPEDATNPKVKWTSSDPKIVSVSNGTINGLKVGTATITATATDGSNQSDSCKVTVYQQVTRISAKKTKVAVTEGQTLKLEPEVYPHDARDKTLNWSSDNPRIAKVSQNGLVSGLLEGEVKITATANDGSGKKLVFTVYVEPRVPLKATTIYYHGDYGHYDSFALKFKNTTETRKVTYFEFQMWFDGKTPDIYYYTDADIEARGTKKVGYFSSKALNYASTIKVKLQYVRYADGTQEYFYDLPTIATYG